MAREKIDRRLAAILSADVVGYSRLMGIDEAGTLGALRAHRAELIDPTIAAHNGRIVKLMGDGLLVEFASAINAVECAAEIQQGMAVRNTKVPDDRLIAFRIGVNLGDVIIDDDDIYGDGVNVAARLQEVAAPGGIYLSGTVFEHVDGKVDADLVDMGNQQLKNMAKPIRVSAWTSWIFRRLPGSGPSLTCRAKRKGQSPVGVHAAMSDLKSANPQSMWDIVTAGCANDFQGRRSPRSRHSPAGLSGSREASRSTMIPRRSRNAGSVPIVDRA